MSTEQASIGQDQVPNVANMGESNSVSMNVDGPPTQDETQCSNPNNTEETQPQQRSSVWKDFERKKIDGKWKAICNHCSKRLLGEPSQGTNHLHNHIKNCIRRSTSDIRQAVLKTTKKGSDSVLVGSYAFNQEVARRALAKMIIFHEYPMSMVDHVLFKEFCSALQPLFKGISRNTVKSDILKMYNEEKVNTKTLVSKNLSRVAITTDMWTASNQNRGYMAVTSHFIDDSWVLQSRLVRFIYVPAPHTSEVLSDCLYQCLLDWNLDRKLSTLTVDNCTTNDKMIECMLHKISPRSFILGGQLFHMRCCAHILNLIVKDGLSIISSAIERVRDSVNFWTATPKREEKFKETCEQLNIPYDKKLELDCKTRWNSTFLMLHVAIIYKDVFERLSLRESLFKTLPSEDDWDMANEICQRLKLFYNVTLVFSGTLYPTANVLFPKICEIKLALIEWLQCPNFVIHQMAEVMCAKFDKYWGDIGSLMAVGAVLDPRYKLCFLKFFYPIIYGEQYAYEMEKVKGICENLVKEYEMKMKGKESVFSSSSQSHTPNLIDAGAGGVNVDWRAKYQSFVSEQNIVTAHRRSELDIYLDDGVLPDEGGDFDILVWWKVNGIKYPTLQRIARDLLAIPISTVASESTFSTGGRILSPHRSRLLPGTVEALMCLQDWLRSSMKGSSKSILDIIQYGTIVEDVDESTSQVNTVEGNVVID